MATRKTAPAAPATLRTSHKNPLDTMSKAHFDKIMKWEPMLEAIGGHHVWAQSPRFVGRGDGPYYLAIKVGAKDYRIVEFDSSKPTTKAKVVKDGVKSPKEILNQFGPYRLAAKVERDEKRAAAKSATKPATKPATKSTATTKRVVKKTA